MKKKLRGLVLATFWWNARGSMVIFHSSRRGRFLFAWCRPRVENEEAALVLATFGWNARGSMVIFVARGEGVVDDRDAVHGKN